MNLKNSLYKVEPKFFNAEIELPTSKSHANRALIIGALKGNGFSVANLPISSDVANLLSCLKNIGLKINQTKNSVSFLNSFPECETETKEDIIDLQTGDGGTTNRFLIALLSLGKKTYRLFPTEKMSERPIEDLLLPLKKLNVHLETSKLSSPTTPWVSLKGAAILKNVKSLEIDCSKSTQFASALMLALSKEKISFDLKHIEASRTYLEMTKHVLEVTKEKNMYVVPVDFSSLSYPLALALINGNVLIKNCHEIDPLQADSAFISLMEKSGADIKWTKEGLRASSEKKLSSFVVDGSICPDLVPTLAFMAAHIEGESTLSNLSILKHKESDRLEEILKLLKIFSVDFDFIPESCELKIRGSHKKYVSAKVETARDHRMVMTAYLFLRAGSGGELANADCTEKSFPHFFDIMK